MINKASLEEITKKLLVANEALAHQNSEKEKRAAELVIANQELVYQNSEKEKRAAELIIANQELLHQNSEKEKRAAELLIANNELLHQNSEKEKRAAELLIANNELLYQFSEKEKRAAELVIANQELLFQNTEKEKRAAELLIANEELKFQNTEKDQRAAELSIANQELNFQNSEKEKRAADLLSANQQLSFQIEENIKHAEQLDQALHSAASLRAAQAIVHIGNWEFDLETEVHIWSDEMYAILGVEKQEEEPSKEYFLSFVHSDDLEETKLKVNEAFNSRKASAYHFRFIRRDGNIRYGFTERKFEFDENNKPIRLLGVVQDITERRLAEFEREKMISELIQRTKSLEQFAYIVSHNLRAPVAHILGISNLLRENISEADRKTSQDILFKATNQLDFIIKDLNYILQIRSDITSVKETIYLENLVNDIESSIQNLIKNETVKIETNFLICDQIISIRGYIYSVLFNLISNSIKYRKPGIPSIINICSSLTSNGVRIKFKDNGLGIDMTKHGDKVFGLYKRFHLHIEGKGLGLFMIKTQVEALGGTIKVHSEPNEGIEFVIDLPN